MREIKTGDILVVLDGKWKIAKMIQKVTATRAHHTGIFVWIEGKLYVSEMEGKGHFRTPWQGVKYKGGYPADRTLVIMQPKEPFPDPIGLVDFTVADTTGYDFLALVQHFLLRFTGRWWGKKGAAAANRLTCSERVGYIYNKFTGLYPHWWMMSPRDIVDSHVELFNYFPANVSDSV
jgi:hypothetical protein